MATKIATTMAKAGQHRDGNFKDRVLATRTRGYSENNAPEGNRPNTKPGRGIDNPVK